MACIAEPQEIWCYTEGHAGLGPSAVQPVLASRSREGDDASHQLHRCDAGQEVGTPRGCDPRKPGGLL